MNPDRGQMIWYSNKYQPSDKKIWHWLIIVRGKPVNQIANAISSLEIIYNLMLFRGSRLFSLNKYNSLLHLGMKVAQKWITHFSRLCLCLWQWLYPMKSHQKHFIVYILIHVINQYSLRRFCVYCTNFRNTTSLELSPTFTSLNIWNKTIYKRKTNMFPRTPLLISVWRKVTVHEF